MLPAAILAIIEALSAEGGAASALGGGAAAGGAEGGLLGMLGRMLGGAKPFGSDKELGEALRKIYDLHQTIEQAQGQLDQNRKRQENIAKDAREQEQKFAFSDPAHAQALADLARQNQILQEQMRQSQRQLTELQNRATLTTDPQARTMQLLGQVGKIIGVAGAVSSLAPRIIRNLPAVHMASDVAEAGGNVARIGVTPTSGAILSEAGQTVKGFAGSIHPTKPFQTVTKLSVEVSKLPTNIMRWSDALVESQRSISRFNGALAITFAEQERRGVLRAIESGKRTGGATADLSNVFQDLQDTLQPIKDTMTIFVARSLTVGIGLIQRMLTVMESIYGIVRVIPGVKQLLQKAEEEVVEMVKKSEAESRRRLAPLADAFEAALARDKKKRLGVPKR